MPRLIKKVSRKAGLSPGSLVHVGTKKMEEVRITITDYDRENLEEREAGSVEECFPFKDKPSVTWMNLDGLHDPKVIEAIGSHYNLHPLLMEDVLNTDQRPKMEDFGEHIFFVMKMIDYDRTSGEILSEQFSMVLGQNYIISFQERVGDVFDGIRERIRSSKGRIRKMGADYLAYALIDALVDRYFSVLEHLGDKMESMEDELMSHGSPEMLQKIYHLKRDLVFLRKSIWPLREVTSGMQRAESELIGEDTDVFLRDVYDHTIQIIDTVESFRDVISGMHDTYLSNISNRMNEVMKVLTIFATIFIPLTFIAGIYGMNFEHMPELAWRWSYLFFWVVALAVGIGMFVSFKRRKWL
jgi:magnesium transporter